MYGRRSPDSVHEILSGVGATHIILEDKICLSLSRELCRLPDIIDIDNGHLPDSIHDNPPEEYSALKKVDIPRFCDEIRHLKLPYSKYFKKAFENKTFRLYRVI